MIRIEDEKIIWARMLGIDLDKTDLQLERHKLRRYKVEYRLPFVNQFLTQHNQDIPTPFVELLDQLCELQPVINSQSDEYFSDSDWEASIGIFWRLYACYRHGLDWEIVLEQINLLDEKLKTFWLVEYNILRQNIIPYVIINRYIIKPLNWLIYESLYIYIVLKERAIL